MAREIKYRGKRLDNGEWAYGFPCQIQEDDGTYKWIIREDTTRHIANITKVHHAVMPESISRSTTLLANGIEVFPGDILEHDHTKGLLKWIVEDEGWRFVIVNIGIDGGLHQRFPITETHYFLDRSVIGNSTDNPGLLDQ